MSGRYNFRRSTRVQRLPPQHFGGPPTDPTPRIAFKIEDLDLEKSYVGTLVSPKRPPGPKKSRPWAKWTGSEPLNDPAKLPHGWHMNEDDLEIDDVDGQIKRCHERIAENIMPHVFYQRLEEYLTAKAKNDQMRFPGSEELSWDTIQRVHQLETMKTELPGTGDEYEQLPNIEAILEAYKSGTLDWNTGLVTYWSHGVQICQPRRFDWDEFEAINSHYEGHKGFWTEGLDSSENDVSYAAITTGPCHIYRRLTRLTLALRVPGVPWFAELDFIHDTGCSRMCIYQGDLSTLLGPFGASLGSQIPVICMGTSQTCNGAVTRQLIEIEVTILDQGRQRMTPWTRTTCSLCPGSWTYNSIPRLDGPIVHDLLYVASAPDSSRRLHISTTRSELDLPDLDLATNPGHHHRQSTGSIQVERFADTYGNWLPEMPGSLIMPPAAAGVPL